ncbi:MAG: DUF1934 domain-containing protein [Clostridium sp.]
MTKDVLVSITGAHAIDGETGDVEVITAGSYYCKNGYHYVIYDETIEGVEDSIRNTIKIGTKSVDVIKNGGAHSHMVFEKQKKNVSCYATPYGQMMIGINTNDIEVNEEENKLQVRIDYALDINYEEVSKCRLTMKIQSRTKTEFHLGS